MSAHSSFTHTGITSTLPATVEIIFSSDLPNGPYGEIAGMGGNVYIPEGSTYLQFADALIQAWNDS